MALFLTKDSYEWALNHLLLEGDTDLLPAPFEFAVIKSNWNAVLLELLRLDVRQYQWSPVNKYLVPKDQLAFRLASQLEPIDALIFAALIKEAGPSIHAYRERHSAGIAYSYWFDPRQMVFFLVLLARGMNFGRPHKLSLGVLGSAELLRLPIYRISTTKYITTLSKIS